MTAQEKILSRLTEGSATAQELASLCACRQRSIPPIISRLRAKQFRILGELTAETHNPRYTLLGGPGSLGPSFICPKCQELIHLGHIHDHHEGCAFGPATLRELGVIP